MNFESKLELGSGIYTSQEISKILRLPSTKINRWINRVWDEKFGDLLNFKYAWSVKSSKAVNFHTLIELYTFYILNQSGVQTKKIIDAHNILAEEYSTPFPFANANIIGHIQTDGKHIYFIAENKSIITLNATQQFNLSLISIFFKKIEFDHNSLATRLWPLGKDRSIICDPHNQFGHPVIENTNTYPEMLNELYLVGEPIPFIASLYNVQENQVEDAIEFCREAA